ncbi:nuclease [Burkholderia sp. Leaf177]|uniref:VRR-NUC domain-containing protein n=1 Tax=Burkholderia sp. Leaf177 TaxID=1736287 RepID=UPI0006F60837|nr:VRR-NUC domain-containing protein [Burkholderia sp. Leaf177]KQR78938.1 nuclease [Burkholderia sp. Leaf177]
MSDPTSSEPADFQRRFYYLLNFERALEWLADRYDDLWAKDERDFLREFPALPLASRALLVRMLMRVGPFFRASKLLYDEIGCPLEALAPLGTLGWVDTNPPLTLDEIFSLHTKPELRNIFSLTPSAAAARKSELRESLSSTHAGTRIYGEWHPGAADVVMRLNLTSLCERLRLMFFGNLRQSWAEFVLADLGIVRYERVLLERSSRAFQTRGDIDVFLAVHAYREMLDTIDDLPSIESMIPEIEALPCDHGWLDQRRQKLLYRVGQYCERLRHWDTALTAYRACAFPGARHRRMRALEQAGFHDDAHTLALQALSAPESEEEAQRVARMLPRLQRKLGLPVEVVRRPRTVERIDVLLPLPSEPASVEIIVRDALSEPGAGVHYVENMLINSLFGLLCWDAIFLPLPGAFFHPFQRGPADLHSPGFHTARRDAFDQCLSLLDTAQHEHVIRSAFVSKAGVQSPFVHWGMLTNELLEQALLCLPAAHMKLWFCRLLQDVGANRTGFPDLIRFWPEQKRYEMIEVKGPGDRLQDNQTRWLAYCAAHDMPVRVVHVKWAEAHR